MSGEADHRRETKTPRSGSANRFSARFVIPMLIGTSLNPINSTIIAIATISIAHEFGVGLDDAAWLNGGFYIAAAVCQPIAGGLADRVGPHRVFQLGLLIVVCASLAGAATSSMEVLIASRVLQGVGTSAAYPSAMKMLRTNAESVHDHGVARALGAIAVTSQVIGAIAPPLGGLLLGAIGWRATLLVNVPVAVGALVMAQYWLPHDNRSSRPAPNGRRFGQVRDADPIGIVLFTAALCSLMLVLLDLDGHDVRPVAATVGFGAALIVWERRRPDPLIDVRIAVTHPALAFTFARYALSAVGVYGAFIGLPQWLQDGRGLGAAETGALMLPLCLTGVLVSMATARWTHYWRSLATGHTAMLAGSAWLLVADRQTPLWALACMTGCLGISVGLVSTANQVAMYQQAASDRAASAAGMFRASWYVGAISCVGLVGFVFGDQADDHGLHELGVVMIVVSGVLLTGDLVGALRRRRLTPS